MARSSSMRRFSAALAPFLRPRSSSSTSAESEPQFTAAQMTRQPAGRPRFAAYGPLMAFGPSYVSGLGEEGVKAMPAGEPPRGTVRQIELDLRVDVRDLLPRITALTLVVGATRDHLVPVEHARALHAAIPGSEYAELDSGHVVLQERPEEVVTLIRHFIDGEQCGES
uniref:alpha/beta fold hydrolase n=1 Tax=Nonomuraea pusilla TaxID=46177 RepID=UPI00159C4B22|nr:alpha/beta hydrolase [Nonomuraea pusilla]